MIFHFKSKDMRLKNDNQDTICTTTGSMFSLFITISPDDFIKTLILACVGAIVSFLMTVLLKWLYNKFRK